MSVLRDVPDDADRDVDRAFESIRRAMQQQVFEIEGYRHILPSRGLPVGPATIAVRPSRLVIDTDQGVTATVAKATYVGVRMEYTLSGDFGQVFAVHENVDAPLEPGARVRMGFAEKGPVLLPE